MIIKYENFINENNIDKIDPYGEESWGDDIIFDFKVGDDVITKGTIFYGLSPNGKIELKNRIGKVVRIKEKEDSTMIVVKFEGERHLLGTILSPYKDCWPFFVSKFDQYFIDGYFKCYSNLFIKKL